MPEKPDNAALFADKADLYAAARPRYPAALFQWLGSLVANHQRAWDCATGNGQAAAGLASVFAEVQATDISKEQIANAVAAANIHYAVQPAEASHFPDQHFDLVNVAQALHWFATDAYWAEVHRVLRPDGCFAAFGYVWPEVDAAIDAVVADHLQPVIEPYWAPNNRLLWHGYRDLELPFAPLPVPELMLENHWQLQQFVDYLHTWSAVRRCMDAQGPAFFQSFTDALHSVWGDPQRTRVVRSPLTLLAGRAW